MRKPKECKAKHGMALNDTQNSAPRGKTTTKKEILPQKKRLGGILFAKMARGGAAELRSNAEEINQLNVFPVPDGDTGDNMRMTIESGIMAIENLHSDNLAEVMRTLSHGMLLGARGNSGVILSQFFAGVAEGFGGAKEADPYSLGEALKLGVERAYKTVLTPTEGTILTVAREAVEYAVSKITTKTTIKSFFAHLADEMYASLERTPEILPALKSAGVVDSGGAGLFYIIDGFRRVLNGEEISENPSSDTKKIPDSCRFESFNADSEMTFAYCTELLIRLLNKKCDVEAFDIKAFKDQISTLGDSVCIVYSDGIIKLHVHSFTPEMVIEYARRFGELISVKIENMNLEHSSTLGYESDNKGKTQGLRKELFTKSSKASMKHRKRYATIAVSSGKGFTDIFYDIGTDKVIEDKTKEAPSARDFIDAIGSVDAEDILIFPNNSNFILAAKQAAKLCEKKRVHVIETKSIGTGYAALLSLDKSIVDTDKLTESLYQVIDKVSDGCTSLAVRSAEFDGVKVKKGDTVGIIGKKIVLSCRSGAKCAESLAIQLLSDKKTLYVFFGKGESYKSSERLACRIKEKVPESEVYYLPGGQVMYPFIFVAI